ncbi:MAG: HIRAN domain-containing protein [Armatimonadetes bacterium]|nr:HIRAN domain-containing protein [Armatimonadota bacterium]
MSASLTPTDPAILALLRGSFGATGLPLPFVQEIFLLECHVAGTSHVDLDAIEPRLQPGELFRFLREPENPHDELAILILTEAGEKLGYVPRAKNEVLARLMDGGKLVFAKLEAKEWVNAWLKLDVRVYLRDY